MALYIVTLFLSDFLHPLLDIWTLGLHRQVNKGILGRFASCIAGPLKIAIIIIT